MSFKKNILANYIGLFYSQIITIVVLPSYLQYLGSTGFGLVAVYMALQPLLNLLNIGLVPALSREIACHREINEKFIRIQKLLRSLEIIFLLLNFLVILIIFCFSPWIAHHWLQLDNTPHHEVIRCIEIMGIIIAFRLFSDLYRESILAMEKQVWLNGVSIIITTIRYIGAYVLLRWISRDPIHFFEYQLLASVTEAILLGIKFYSELSIPAKFLMRFKISWGLLREVAPYAGGLFYSSILWFFATQSDKFVLSHILSLSTYGYFGLVMLISSGIMQCIVPINLAFLPRLTNLFSQGKKESVSALYRQITQIVAVIIFPVIAIVAIFGEQIVYVLTGNRTASNWAGPILFWYALGNGFFAMNAFTFYLQSAIGKVKLQVIIDTVFSIFSVPLIVFFAYHSGAKGVAIAGCVMRGILFFIQSALVHNTYMPGLHCKWLMKDIFPILSVTSLAVWCLSMILADFKSMNRAENLIILVAFTCFLFIVSFVTSSTCRYYFLNFICRKRTS
ncbi:MAG: hypothetical protein A3F12_00815 [Gammaproteobacteria bacterium RIFCSPHIGHO2_12_FULL_38_14]|nr:MAG: hypothetical protein A3F12_00815 [Gammaproteobacteria bacterium RIFCSPHIGHO2_12_FULL_38_14]